MHIYSNIVFHYNMAQPTVVRFQTVLSSGWKPAVDDEGEIYCTDPTQKLNWMRVPAEEFNLQSYLKAHASDQYINIVLQSELDARVRCILEVYPKRLQFELVEPKYLNEELEIANYDPYFKALKVFCSIENPCYVECMRFSI